MKKIYFSLITIAILLFAACNNDVPANPETSETGTLRATISFGGKADKSNERSAADNTRAGEASSTAVPIVSWNNVNQVQLFLYRADGTIGFSQILKPADADNPDATDGRIFNIPNIPLGNYKLALLANASNNTDNVTTSLNGGTTWGVEFTNMNVRGQKISDLLVDMKGKDLPRLPQIVWNEQVGYDTPSEIFTVVDLDVNIEGGKTADVKVEALKREISLMRTRFDIETVPTDEERINRAKVDFDTDNNFIVVQCLPKHFNVATGMSAESDSKRVLVAVTGKDTYQDEDPKTGYKSNDGSDNYKIIDGTFKRWNDTYVFPNVEGRNGTDITDKKYFIIIAAWVNLQPGETYTYEDGKIASKSQPVYWWALVEDAFTRNVIREVNLTLETAGYLEFPDEPTAQGGLKIEIGAPEEWNTVIERTDMNI